MLGRIEGNVKTNLLQQTREPMHDIERQLPVVDSGTVHSERHAITCGELRRQHRRFAQDDDTAFAKAERDSLRATGGRDCGVLRKLHLHGC